MTTPHTTPLDTAAPQLDKVALEKTWENTHDFKQAVYAADKALDEPYADPDDDLRTIARQFNRMVERYDYLLSLETKHIAEVEAVRKNALEVAKIFVISKFVGTQPFIVIPESKYKHYLTIDYLKELATTTTSERSK